jgi:hypothetical protein
MSECSICKLPKPDVEERLGRMSCLKCAQDRSARALSNYVIAMSEKVVETAFGWSTALCLYGDPVEWLCLHIHDSKDEAQACLTETVSHGGGVFPIR